MNRLLRTNLFVLCFIVIYFVTSFALGVIAAFWPALTSNPLYSSLLIYGLSFGIPALIYALICCRKTGQSLTDFLALRRISFTSVLLTIAAAILVQPTMMLISSISQLFFQNITTDSMLQMAQLPLWTFLLASAVLPAFFEELICRGIILQGYRETPFWYALLISAAFFGMLHLNFQQILYAIAAGIFFALLVKATGSIWSSILAHLIINGLQSLIAWFMLQNGLYEEAAAAALPSSGLWQTMAYLFPYIFLALITLPLLILCLYYLFKNNRAAVAAQPAASRWHAGAWLMYIILGFLFLYSIFTEIILNLSISI